MDFYIAFILVFVVGTAILLRTKMERHSILFLIRTQHFLNFIKWLAELSPKFWKFLADLAIVFSFSGLGAAYLSRYRKLSPNLSIILFILGLISILGSGLNPIPSLLMLILLLIIVYILHKVKNQQADFLFCTLLISLIFLRIPAMILFQFGLEIQIPLWIALLEGMFGVVPLILGALASQAYNILFLGSEQAGLAPAIPSTQGGRIGISFFGTGIFIPLVYAILAISITLVSHEFSHGILSMVHGIRLKSTGLLTFGIIPIGAFIEPDEDEIKRRSSIERMRIFSVGSFANLLIALLSTLLLILASIAMVFYPMAEGIQIVDTFEGYPADGVLKKGMIIYKINDESVKSGELFKSTLSKLTPGQEITIRTDQGEFKLQLATHPEDEDRAFIGISWIPYSPIMGFILESLFWILFINFNISLVNLLPMVPFDGWKMLNEVMITFDISDLVAKKVIRGILIATLILLFINVIPLIADILEITLELVS